MHLGTFLLEPTPWPLAGATAGVASVDLGPNPTLYTLALQWLREDRERRRLLEAQGRKARGARNDTVSLMGGVACLRMLTGLSDRFPVTRKRSTGSEFFWSVLGSSDC